MKKPRMEVQYIKESESKENKEKVYCKNCKCKNEYFSGTCIVVKKIYRKYLGDYEILSDFGWCCMRNKNNHCKYYKREWWKWWV